MCVSLLCGGGRLFFTTLGVHGDPSEERFPLHERYGYLVCCGLMGRHRSGQGRIRDIRIPTKTLLKKTNRARSFFFFHPPTRRIFGDLRNLQNLRTLWRNRVYPVSRGCTQASLGAIFLPICSLHVRDELFSLNVAFYVAAGRCEVQTYV